MKVKSLLAAVWGFGGAVVFGFALAAAVLWLYLSHGHAIATHAIWIAGTATLLTATGVAVNALTSTRHLGRRSTR